VELRLEKVNPVPRTYIRGFRACPSGTSEHSSLHLRTGRSVVRGKWTEAIAVGSKEFVEATAERLGIRGIGRQISKEKGGYELREPTTPYSSDFDPKNATLSQENTYFWNEST